MIGHTLGHFEIVAELGEGGMGAVYRGRDSRLGREVAIKVLPQSFAGEPERLERFQREARILATLNHPGIAAIYEIGEQADVRFLVLELVDGKTLEDEIPAGGMELRELLRVATALTDAVAAAHARGIVHRDLKPSNVMLDSAGNVKVLDFGLARSDARAEGSTSDSTTLTGAALTRLGTAMGTLPYMSPELVRGEPAGPPSDVFSLGIVLYEMGAGRRPFGGGSSAELASSILRDHPPALSSLRHDLPAAFSDVVARCLEKEREGRFANAGELSAALDASGSAGIWGSEIAEAIRSIAVLPFVDLSPEGDQEYFCDGISEEIISSLSRIESLRVASRTSAFAFKKSDADLRTVGSRLGVTQVLEGSVRKAGKRLRISVQLLDVAGDTHLWSEKYDRDLKDVFAIQEDIAESVVRALEVTLTPGESRALRQPPTKHADAYDFYLRGREFFYKASLRDHEFARQMFTRAIELDGSFTRAYAGLADTNSYVYKHFKREPAILAEAEAASRKALELAPDLAEAHTSRGVVHWLHGRYERADREFETAIQLAPDLFDAHYLYGIALYNRGELEESARRLEQASAVRPEDYQSPLILGALYRGLDRGDAAKRAYQRGLEIAESHLELNPDDARAWYLGAGALVVLGDASRGLEWAERALALDHENPLVFYNLAGIYGAAGRIEEGIQSLEKAVQLGFSHREGLENDPDFKPLRSDPRFVALIDGLDGSVGETSTDTGDSFAAAATKAQPSPESAPTIESIAVLPLTDLSGQREETFFTDGMAEALITDLAKLGGFRVISRASSSQYSGTGKSEREIGRELGVEALLLGAVLRVEDRVRINARLVLVETEAVVWAEGYERRFEDVLSLQAEVARAIAAAVGAAVGGGTGAIEARRKVNPDAYLLNLRGQHLLARRTEEGFRAASRCFRQAVDLDPTDASSWAGLADAYGMLANYGHVASAEIRNQARAAAERALELDPDSAHAHRVAAFALWQFEFAWEKAIDAYERAVDLDPNSAVTWQWFGAYLTVIGYHRRGRGMLDRAASLDPLSLLIPALKGWAYYFERRYEEALPYYRRVLQEEPEHFVALWFQGEALVELGQLDRGVESLEQALEGSGRISRLLGYLGYAYGRAGRRGQAEELLAELHRRAEARYVPPYFTALVWSGLGEADRALDDLERAYETRDTMIRDLRADSQWDRLRSLTRFERLMAALAFPNPATEAG